MVDSDTNIVGYFAYEFHDTVVNTIHDTLIVTITDTSRIDTIYIHDTLYIHDTVYIIHRDTVNVSGFEDDIWQGNVFLYNDGHQIVVEGAGEMPVRLYDATGRLLAMRRSEVHGGTPLRFDVTVSGTYLVRIGNLPAKKIVVIR